MSRILADLRYAGRLLARGPVFATAAIATLALGIGASTAVFSVVDGILFRPLGLPDSGRLVTLCETHASQEGYCGVSPTNVLDWAERAEAIETVGVGRGEAAALRSENGVRYVSRGLSTPGLFAAIGVAPLLGRTLTEEDGPPRGAGAAVVLSEGFWRTELGADPGVLGRSLILDDESFTVVGVLPARAQVPRLDFVDVWTPLPFDARSEEFRDWRGFIGIARLAPGASAERAQAELGTIQQELGEVHPEALRGWGARVVGLRDFLVADVRPTLLVFLGAVAIVLLIVCVNMASLLLARASARSRELAVRRAVGAGRGDLTRQLLVESGVLAGLGGAAGVLVSLWLTEAFIALAPAGMPRIDGVAVNGRALAFALGVSVLSGVIFGLAPVLRAGAVAPADALRGGLGARGAPAVVGRARRALVVGQVALALVLVFSAMLLLRSFAGLLDWRPGFETDRLLTFQVFVSPSRYPDGEQVVALYRRLEDELRAIPGVASVGNMSAGPLTGGGDGAARMLAEGRDWTRETAPAVSWFDAGPGYFPTLGLPLLAGRGFDETDAGGVTRATRDARHAQRTGGAARVALINRSMARRFWPEGDPVGARVDFPELEWTGVEVVGVVPDIEPFYPGQPPRPEIYFSNRQRTRWGTYFLVRTDGDPGTMVDAVSAAVQRVDPGLQALHLRTLNELIGRELVRPRFNTVLVGVFAAVALILGIVGIYGVIAYTVALRTQELGIRMALGADARRVLAAIMGEGARMVLAGAAVGLVGALAAGRALAGLLHGVRPLDPLALTLTLTLLLLAGAAAAYGPARRASRLDPLEALREE